MQTNETHSITRRILPNFHGHRSTITHALNRKVLARHWSGVEDNNTPLHCVKCTRSVERAAALTFLLIAKFRAFANDKPLPTDIARVIAKLCYVLE